MNTPFIVSGELLALGTALCWTITSIMFSEAGRRVGSLNLNLIRLLIALGFFTLFQAVTGGELIPFSAPQRIWATMGISGLIGFVLGDLFLFQAFILIGPRLSMLVYSSVPVITLVLGWFFLGETLGAGQGWGVALTLGGILMVIALRNRSPSTGSGETTLREFVVGVLCAFLGSIGQAGGLIVGRFGAGTEYSAFAATQIRVIAGIIGFLVVFILTRRWRQLWGALHNAKAYPFIVAGSFFGPFLGVSLGLWAAQRTQTGIAATLMAIVPVLIVIPSILIYKEKINLAEIIGTGITLWGVSFLL
ncbi:DMT family transporter [Spirochaeta lutea]|uniref:EamA domain-containing protein n=1 Tax=Spirochaeta lutea TaxID=1480694 RepID=A0A098QWI4_9SPIO|nr:DMT family transporter [Spirochaeta lutea]KGE71911.1 hypothetical protein DC28_08880 [Spirochaeta lutea]